MNPRAIVAILLTLIVGIVFLGVVYKAIFIIDGLFPDNVSEHWINLLSMIVGGLIAYVGIANK